MELALGLIVGFVWGCITVVIITDRTLTSKDVELDERYLNFEAINTYLNPNSRAKVQKVVALLPEKAQSLVEKELAMSWN